ncbi:hypothetical protein QQF64_012661 [Cirrhinus molitorella]|uniref:Kielin/chordin-like protein n=1 Tax=Cirrhinus molitorella TaxID=172907 RepID=A0ABR3LYK5_9TELE
MELKALVGGVFMSLLVFWNVCDSVQTHQDANHKRGAETVINLLEALNITRSPRGVAKVKGRDPETPAWRFRSTTPHLKLPQKVLDYLFKTSQGVLGLHLVGRQNKSSEATLISITSTALLQNATRPLLELVSSTQADWLQLEFRSADGLQTEVLKVPGGSPFTGGGWVRMALSVEPRQIVLYVDCQDAVVLKLKGGGQILTLDFPQDLQTTFSSTAGKKASKFSGAWQAAELSTKAYEMRPWFCDNVTDSLPDTVIPTVPAVYDLDMMQDQGYRGDGVVSATGYPVNPDTHLGQLKNNLNSIRTMLEMLKSQNTALQARVAYLETCECSKRKCVWEGRQMSEGSRWTPDSNTVCSCTQGRVQCSRLNECSFHGNIYSNGHNFRPDDCNHCTCEHGRVECYVNPCPLRSCQQPPATEGTCCPTCQTRCEHEGKIYENGDVIVSRSNACTKCICSSGNIVCNNQPCPELSCNLVETVGGQCCPRCRTCVQDNVRHEHGSQWKLSNDPCTTCTCMEGQVHCESERCNIRCRNPASPPRGSCCPVCDGCSVNGKDIPNGMRLPPGSPCDPVCTCENGNINCAQQPPCPPTPCRNPVRRPGECCARCEECTYDGQSYIDGQTFVSRQDPCLRCQCSGGQMSCKSATSSCQPQSCTHPAKPHDQCCPTCNTCEYEGRVYEDGEDFRPPGGGSCIQCSCKNGNVRCHQERCPSLNCAVPTPAPPNTCCPVCQGCVWNGVQKEEGATWTDGGRRCSCVNGQVTCSNDCPDANPDPCPNRRGDDCRGDSSGQCQYKQRVYENGERFKDPDNGCLTCTCQNGQTHCAQAPCAQPRCANPYTPPGECCPQCPENVRCLYNQRWYENGQTFRDPDDACKTCICQDGQTSCAAASCPRPRCANAYTPPGECCPQCAGCVWNGVRQEEGATWNDGGRRCSCVNGQVSCSNDCPNANPDPCQNRRGDDCRGGQCQYKQRMYENGQTFQDPDDPCTTCTCRDGQTRCASASCPRPLCANPYTPPGECCPQCPENVQCLYNQRWYENGQTFRDPDDACKTCTCQDGETRCNLPGCSPVTCANAYTPPGECCPRCLGCVWNGVQQEEGATWSEGDRTCYCVSGQVTCRSNCPPSTLVPPKKPSDDCCGESCGRCQYKQRMYENGQSFKDPDDACTTCTCQGGNVRCVAASCPQPTCRNAYTPAGECCPRCPVSRCEYDNRIFANGETFPNPSNPCENCVCNDGHVSCGNRECAKPNCNYPQPGTCCQNNCNGCRYAGNDYLNGVEFPHSENKCKTCHCINGNVQCLMTRCPVVNCADAFIPSGECCPQCPAPPAGCIFEGQRYAESQQFLHPNDRCQLCSCTNGVVSCHRRPCPSAVCPHPVIQECCRTCDGCMYEGQEYQNGQEFPDPVDRCGHCVCRNGHVTCNKGLCQNPGCSNPHTRPNQCCPACDGCLYHGRDCGNGERFPDPNNQCQDCSCLNGSVSCTPVSCPEAPCRRPVRPPGECCPTCIGICEHLGQVYENGATFSPPNDRCSTCTCQNGAVSCERRQCPQQCTHPGSTQDCCPVCDRCLFEGQIYGNTQTFYAPSDPCKRCVCQSGSVRCTPVTCPAVFCRNPITPPGQCCPQCRVCYQEGQKYFDGQSLTLPTDPCFKCTCMGGEMSCVGPECPKLTCMHQVTDPGSCCPRCRGCIYDGVEHLEGSTWFASSSPCMSCMCVNGVTTCSEVHCLSTCLNQISVPGECCPVCADCVYKGHVYSPGESFQPSDDPCQICTCEVMPDGEQHLRCYRKQCPSLVDCPKHNILYSGSDSCCPVCAQPLSNCTATQIGNEVLATDDPCFTCQCKDLTWTCIHQGCPPLSCPLADQHTPPDSCCPICDECVLEGNKTRVPSGQRWTDKENECITCICNQGLIECDLKECPSLDCPDGSIKVKNPGKCCPECTGIIAVVSGQCVHDKQRYKHNDHWEVDECTSCTCVYGDVHCQTQRCPTLTCASDETPALVPGMCCPHCIPHPATCVVFGDPHYRTFDGKMVNFQGTCTYVLAQDCEGGDFSVHVSNEDRGRKEVSWTKEVTVFIGDTVVQLFQDWIVKVDYLQVSLPFLKEPYVYLERKTNTILLNTNLGLKVLWNGRSHLEVSVPGTYKKQMCGLCGNFNNYPQDDMTLRNGQITNSEAAFGNNWKVGSGNPSIQCPDAENINPCNKAGYSARKTANARCAVLKSPVFERCHKLVPPEMFYASCVYDLCACGSNTDECLCDVLEAYASECREAGVILQWRSPTLCAVGCPLDRGYVFDECGPPCPKTCFNKDVPLGVIEAHCFKPCVPGCQCPAGLVEHNGHCIAPEKCPKIILGNL